MSVVVSGVLAAATVTAQSPLSPAAAEEAPVVFRVNSADGDTDGSCLDLTTVGGTVLTDCTLGDAIIAANVESGADVIQFDLPGGAHTISLAGPLPTITDAVEIDGTSQDGYAGTPLIEVAPASGGGFTALRIEGDGTLVSSLAFGGFAAPTGKGVGIHISAGRGNRIEGSWFGFDHTGAFAPNVRDLVVDAGADENVIGGVDAGNVFRHLSLASDDNDVLGNLVGLDPTGTAAAGGPRPWPKEGIRITGHGNIVGGFPARDPGSGNVISGHTIGVHVFGNENNVRGNIVGLDAAGSETIGNTVAGIFVNGLDRPLGTDIAFNTVAGAVGQPSQGIGAGIDIRRSQSTRVFNNRVGTDVSGTAARPNVAGIHVSPEADGINMFTNVVAGNTGTGILVDHDSAENISLSGNLIGIGEDEVAVPNGGPGIEIRTNHQTWGGDVDLSHQPIRLERNRVGGNGGDGVLLRGVDATMRSDEIGVDRVFTPVQRDSAVPNSGNGLTVEGGRVAIRAGVIGHNTGTGIVVRDLVFPDGSVNPGRVTVTDTSTFENGGVGIDVGDNGPNPYDPADGAQDAPVITTAERTPAGDLHVAGHVEMLDPSHPEVILEIYDDGLTGCDPSGFGEGFRRVHVATVPVNSSSVVPFDFTVNVLSDAVTMTATPRSTTASNQPWYFDPPTSEHSACVQVPEGTADLEADLFVISPTPAGEPGHITATVRNNGPDPVATATFEVRVPAGTTEVGVSSGTTNSTCSQATVGPWTVLTCVTTVHAGSSATFVMNPVYPEPGASPVTLTVSMSGSDPDPTNDSETEVVHVT